MSLVANRNLILNFSAGTGQALDVRVDIPFPVKKLVFNPPRNFIVDAPGNYADNFLINSSLTDDNSVVGFVDGRILGVPGHPITVVLKDQKQFSGLYTFRIRSVVNAAGGAVTDYVGRVWMNIEFHESR